MTSPTVPGATLVLDITTEVVSVTPGIALTKMLNNLLNSKENVDGVLMPACDRVIADYKIWVQLSYISIPPIPPPPGMPP
jgi:hypothetical protein